MSWNLFKHMSDEYGLTLVQSEVDEIRDAVHADDEEAARQAVARDADCIGRGILVAEPSKAASSYANPSNDFGGMA